MLTVRACAPPRTWEPQRHNRRLSPCMAAVPTSAFPLCSAWAVSRGCTEIIDAQAVLWSQRKKSENGVVLDVFVTFFKIRRTCPALPLPVSDWDMQANAPVCDLGLPHRSVTVCFEAARVREIS